MSVGYGTGAMVCLASGVASMRLRWVGSMVGSGAGTAVPPAAVCGVGLGTAVDGNGVRREWVGLASALAVPWANRRL